MRIYTQIEKLKKGAISYIAITNNSKFKIGSEKLEFIVVTKSGNVMLFTDVDEASKNNGPSLSITNQQPGIINSVECHPHQPLLAISGSENYIHIWDYEKKSLVVSRHFAEDKGIQAINFSSNGDLLAVGHTSGTLAILNSNSLEDAPNARFKISKVPLHNVTFDQKVNFCACSDAQFAVALISRKEGETQWAYIGKYRVHLKPISSLLFSPPQETPRLISTSEDRYLIEYDLSASTPETGLIIKSRKQLEQSSRITAATWYYPDWSKQEKYLLTANSEYKLRLYRNDSLMCRYTFLGPTFGGPLT
jgi:WD40 repeat protein